MPDSSGGQRLLTRSEYAGRRKVSRAMVSKYEKGGRLVVVDGLIDADASDALLTATLDPARGGKRAKPARRPKTKRAPRSRTNGVAFIDERTRREKFAAQLLKVEYEKVTGVLVDRAEYNRAWTENLGPAIERLRSISARLGARLAAESDVRKCSDMLDDEISDATQEIADNAQALIDGFGKRRQ